jgi:hypothetical protein
MTEEEYELICLVTRLSEVSTDVKERAIRATKQLYQEELRYVWASDCKHNTSEA